MAVVAVGPAILLVYQAETPGCDGLRADADAAAYRLERTPVSGPGVYAWDLQRASAGGTAVPGDLPQIIAMVEDPCRYRCYRSGGPEFPGMKAVT